MSPSPTPTPSTFENRNAIFAAHQKSEISEDAEYVIHAAAMPPGGRATEASIRDATQHALEAADDLQCESIVLPAIGCGVHESNSSRAQAGSVASGEVAGFDFEEGVHIICETIQAYDPYYLEDVALIAYSDDEFDAMEQIAEGYQ